MPRCPACSAEVVEGGRYCSECGAVLSDRTSAATETSAESTAAGVSHPSLDRARFIPGTVLAKRYRIIGLLGRGGMGEVYRADDLKLGQPVALKFLPAAVERDRGRLDRFLNEVKVALRVTHPNVCRVHDIGEVEGHHFLSMEYVDGEDLASLLKRIGRLPREKAVQIARQLCAGLAAAHEEGIVHRDLKPANVMLDGRGRAKITDFGLASWAASIEEGDRRAGTPLYMAPEQLAGKEVTVRSDIYSLGLVLYEVFTGKRAFEAATPAELLRLEQESSPKSPSSQVEGLDPVVERAILRCLEREPRDRPASALAVAASLPGGDPLAAALAAGETPSPEMVAAAGPRGTLSPRIAVLCIALAAAGFPAVMWWSANRGADLLLRRLDRSFDSMKDSARDLVVKLGYKEPPLDSVARFQRDYEAIQHLTRGKAHSDARDALSRPGVVLLNLWYRQSQGALVPANLWGHIWDDDPPPSEGDVAMALDITGRLLWLRAVPPFAEWPQGPAPSPDWSLLFQAAGLDIARFEPASPTIQPRVFADSRMAWTGVLPDLGDTPVRIEAATFRGRPVYFERILPAAPHWSEQKKGEQKQLERSQKLAGFFALGLFALTAAGAAFLVVRNLRLGRGDKKGALRLSVFMTALSLASWLVTGHHVPDVLGEFLVFMVCLCGSVTLGLFVGALYLALEPYVRKLWPESVISWTRLLAGRFRDPLVGRDVLVGLSALGANSLASALVLHLLVKLDLAPVRPWVPLGALRGGRYALGEPLSATRGAMFLSLLFLMLFLALRILFRRPWLAAVGFCVPYIAWNFAFSGGAFSFPDQIVSNVLLSTIESITFLIVMTRFGLVALIAYHWMAVLIHAYPQAASVSAPYFALSLVPPLLFLALAVYGYRVSVAGQPLFRDDQATPHR